MADQLFYWKEFYVIFCFLTLTSQCSAWFFCDDWIELMYCGCCYKNTQNWNWFFRWHFPRNPRRKNKTACKSHTERETKSARGWMVNENEVCNERKLQQKQINTELNMNFEVKYKKWMNEIGEDNDWIDGGMDGKFTLRWFGFSVKSECHEKKFQWIDEVMKCSNFIFACTAIYPSTGAVCDDVNWEFCLFLLLLFVEWIGVVGVIVQKDTKTKSAVPCCML